MIETTNRTSFSPNVLNNYLRGLVNQFFKILPIRESEEPSLQTYMQSLQAELIGCSDLVASLNDDAMFLSLISILQYLIDHKDEPVHVYKREVFKAISMCNKLNAKYAVMLDGEEG